MRPKICHGGRGFANTWKYNLVGRPDLFIIVSDACLNAKPFEGVIDRLNVPGVVFNDDDFHMDLKCLNCLKSLKGLYCMISLNPKHFKYFKQNKQFKPIKTVSYYCLGNVSMTLTISANSSSLYKRVR